jgi:crotonobetainyl-CoA:carnitine CoA-transferase CaiB-like acyl-CoA transferase
VHSPAGREFDAHLRSWIAARSVDEVVRAFNAGHVPCCPVMTPRDMAEDPHYRAREAHVEWDDLQVGRVKGTGVAPKFSRTPGKIWRGSVPVGHDNDLVYRDLLGLSQQELEDLRRRHVV